MKSLWKLNRRLKIEVNHQCCDSIQIYTQCPAKVKKVIYLQRCINVTGSVNSDARAKLSRMQTNARDWNRIQS